MKCGTNSTVTKWFSTIQLLWLIQVVDRTKTNVCLTLFVEFVSVLGSFRTLE